MIENFVGARIIGSEGIFRVWAPNAEQVEVLLLNRDTKITMQKDSAGYFTLRQPDLQSGNRYMYSLNGGPGRPDPASISQPEGVHGPSEILDLNYSWTDQHWSPPGLVDSILYELHVGTFTPEGTFEAIIPHLPYLKDLGITTLQLMPIAEFPGKRNWGYDGVQLYAPHSAYGGPEDLKRLVDACHAHELALFLDVVYNHLGPEGNYLSEFGPYFTDAYKSPWGQSVNLDGAYSDHVRHFLMSNAQYWLDEYHIDGLRLDATHALFDFSSRPFLAELADQIQAWSKATNRQAILIAENDQNDRRITLPVDSNGFGMHGQWLDDFHHVLHVALTSEQDGYYLDYQDASLFSKVLRNGFAYDGQYAPFRKRRHGTPVNDLSTERFIASTQTHDQVGNRMSGERLSQLTSQEGLKTAACLLACSPYTPMLFMGEEYGETAPFLYFISHTDENLIEAIRQGRAAEFSAFDWDSPPSDPQSEATFFNSKLNHSLRNSGSHALLMRLYKHLLNLRQTHDALRNPNRSALSVSIGDTPRTICMERHGSTHVIRILLNFEKTQTSPFFFACEHETWQKILDSSSPQWAPDNKENSSLPNIINSAASIRLMLPPLSFALYLSSKPPQ